MKPLLPLLLLLAVPAALAAERGTPQPIRIMPVGATAHVGPKHPRDVQRAEARNPYRNAGVNLGNVLSGDVAISTAVVNVVYGGKATQTYSRLRARVQFWDAWTPQGVRVFFLAHFPKATVDPSSGG